MKRIVALLFISVLVFSCGEDEEIDYLARDIAAIDQYLQDNKIDAIEDESGIRYVVYKTENGDTARCVGDEITTNYIGMLLGRKDTFDTSYDRGQAFSFNLYTNQVIRGWDIGFSLLLAEGDSASLFIPSPLGYGTRGSGSAIPPNSPLEFVVKYEKLRVSTNCGN